MNLSKEVFIKGMKDLVFFYPNWNIAVEETEAMKRWYEMFNHIDDDIFSKMVIEHIKTIKFNPTVASLLEINKLVRPKVEFDDRKPKVPEKFKDWY